MSRFNTGNPLGSGDPRDLDDNAKNMDLAVNSDELRWSDRFGRDRKSFEGMEREFESAQDSRDNAFESAQTYRESRFNDFIASSGYQFAGDYAPGIEITEYNQLVRDEDGEFWRVSGQVDLPYVTTGAGIPEGDALVPAGDAVLRQDLADATDPAEGAAIVARSSVTVESLAELAGLPQSKKLVAELQLGGRSGTFYWNSDDLSEAVAADALQSIYVAPTGGDGSTGAWVQSGGALHGPVVVPVSSSSRFTTIQSAKEFLERFYPASPSAVATIELQSGFVMSEQVNTENRDSGFIRISSIDPTVIIDRSALAVKIGRWYPAFRAENAVHPIIDVAFSMDASGTASERVGLYLINSNCFVAPGAGVQNAGERGSDVTQGSTLRGPLSNWSGALGVGVRVSTTSTAHLEQAEITGCGAGGISCGDGTTVNANNANLSGNAVNVMADGTARVRVQGSNMDNATGAHAVRALNGATINALSASINNAADIAVSSEGGSKIILTNANVNNAGGIGMRADGGGVIAAGGVTATGNSANAYARRGGTIYAVLADLSGGVSNGVFATEGGIAHVNFSNCRKGVSDSTTDIVVASGSFVYAHGATGGLTKTPNILDNKGAIYNGTIVNNFGTVTIPSGATTATVNHGLGRTPAIDEFSLTPRESLAAASKFWIVSANATSLTVAVDVAPGTDVTFSWQVIGVR